jgi:hypothetical protein
MTLESSTMTNWADARIRRGSHLRTGPPANLAGPDQLSQDLGLLRRELVVREDALGLEVREVLQLLDRIGRWGCGSGRGRGRGRGSGVGRLRLLVDLLLSPALRLAARDTVADRRGGAGDGGGADDAAK